MGGGGLKRRRYRGPFPAGCRGFCPWGVPRAGCTLGPHRLSRRILFIHQEFEEDRVRTVDTRGLGKEGEGQDTKRGDMAGEHGNGRHPLKEQVFTVD